MSRSASSREFLPAWLAGILIAGAFALRLPHLTGPVDDPHSWRQCDTVGYTMDLSRRGFDLLHPSVHWLGGHRTLIFECPLPEGLAALLYRAFGADPMWDRLVALAGFALSAFYLNRAIRSLGPPVVARLATLAYALSPLAQFYSRAAHVDFAAQAFAHGLLAHGLLAIERRSNGHALAAASCGALAALIKAPYLAPVMVPLAAAALAARERGALARAAFAVACAAVTFVLWRHHVDAVNSAAPDWDWLPGYYKEVNPLWWYVGDFAQRLQPANAVRLARRLVYEVATPFGAVIALAGFVPAARPNGAPQASVRAPSSLVAAVAWLGGALAYLLVFFPLNVIHNYYQIPFVAPVAFMIALGFASVARYLPRALVVALLALFIGLAAIAPARLGYYRVDWSRVVAGEAIAARVPPGDLVVVVDRASEYSDPRLLQRADRYGWAVKAADLDSVLLGRLRGEGALWLAWLSEPGLARLEPPAWLARDAGDAVTLTREGTVLGTLHLYTLAARPRP